MSQLLKTEAEHHRFHSSSSITVQRFTINRLPLQIHTFVRKILASLTCFAPERILLKQTLITMFSWLHLPRRHSVFCGTQTHLGFRGRFCSWSQEWRGKCMLPHRCIWPKTPGNSIAAVQAVWVTENAKIQACQSINSFMTIVNHCVYNCENKTWENS